MSDKGPEKFIEEAFKLYRELNDIDSHLGYRTMDSSMTVLEDQKGLFRINCDDTISVSDTLLFYFFYF